MKKDINKAEELFYCYEGSKFFMARDDKYEYYRSFNVTREQELIWCRNLQICNLNEMKNLIGKKNREFWLLLNRYLSTVKSYSEFGLLKEVMVYINKNRLLVDSYTKLLISEELLNSYEYCKERTCDISDVVVMKNQAIYLLNDILINDVIIDSEYKIKVSSEILDTDAIKDKVAKLLKKYKYAE